MFLHALPAKTKRNPRAPLNWWAVHCETLTPIRIHIGSGVRVALDFIIDSNAPPIVFSSHPEATVDPDTLTAALMAELIAHANPACVHHSTRVKSPADDHRPPEHLIVFDILGDNPTLWRSADPLMLLPVKDQDTGFRAEAILGQPTHWRTSVDLPATGWEYWWTECQLAMRELAHDKIAKK